MPSPGAAGARVPRASRVRETSDAAPGSAQPRLQTHFGFCEPCLRNEPTPAAKNPKEPSKILPLAGPRPRECVADGPAVRWKSLTKNYCHARARYR